MVVQRLVRFFFGMVVVLFVMVVLVLGRTLQREQRTTERCGFVVGWHSTRRRLFAQLRERHGADVVVMGCAGMARYRQPLQDEIGIPVVEPTQAAVAMAIGRVRLAWS